MLDIIKILENNYFYDIIKLKVNMLPFTNVFHYFSQLAYLFSKCLLKVRIVKTLFFLCNLVEFLHNLSIVIDKERGIKLINFILSLLLGTVPDTLYYYLYLTRMKDIK